MGIRIKKECKKVSHQCFYDIDKMIIGESFNLHNKFGCFFDENLFKDNLERFLNKNEIEVSKEVHLKVTHKNFIKDYYLDLLVNKGIIYELKAVDNLKKLHTEQLINYLLLTNLNYGQLINFGSSSVEKEFVSTNLNYELRKNYDFDFLEWNNQLENSDLLVNILSDILYDWGAFLDYNLYNKALIFFLGGKNKVIQLVDILDNNEIIGKQKFTLLNDKTAFHLSGIDTRFEYYEEHIKRLLNFVNLEAIQWINFNKHKIKFKTIKRKKLIVLS